MSPMLICCEIILHKVWYTLSCFSKLMKVTEWTLYNCLWSMHKLRYTAYFKAERTAWKDNVVFTNYFHDALAMFYLCCICKLSVTLSLRYIDFKKLCIYYYHFRILHATCRFIINLRIVDHFLLHKYISYHKVRDIFWIIISIFFCANS